MQEPLLGLYPGSFDPPTNGHLDIIRRALRVVPRLIVAVAVNEEKRALFSMSERVELIARMLDEALSAEDRARVTIDGFQGLLVDYARTHKARAIIRGLRMVSDFEYEFQMASMNRLLAPELETLVFMTDESNFYISSRTVKEVASLGGDVSATVPDAVRRALLRKFPSPTHD